MDCKLCLLSANLFGIRIGMSPTGFWSDRLRRRLILSYNKDMDNVLRAGNREGYLC